MSVKEANTHIELMLLRRTLVKYQKEELVRKNWNDLTNIKPEKDSVCQIFKPEEREILHGFIFDEENNEWFYNFSKGMKLYVSSEYCMWRNIDNDI